MVPVKEIKSLSNYADNDDRKIINTARRVEKKNKFCSIGFS